MMLLEKVEALKASLAAYRQAKTVGDQANVFKTRSAQCAEVEAALREALIAWQVLNSANISIAPLAPLPGVRKDIEALAATFAADPSSFEASNSNFRHVVIPSIKKRANEIRTSVQDAWEDFVDERADLPRPEILDALGTLPSYRQHVQRIRGQATKVAELRKAAPSRATIDAALTALALAKKEKDEAFAAMSGDDLPAEVLRFLQAASLNGASLADYTDVVRIWLAERNLNAAFRIVSSRT